MAGLNVPGIGSGLDISGMSENLATAETATSIENAEAVESKINSKISNLSKITSGLSSFRDTIANMQSAASNVNKLTYSATEKVVDITSTGMALDGNYDIEVNQIASNHRLKSQEFASGDNFFGSMIISVGSETASISIDDNSSIYSLANSINEAQDFASAVVINNGSGNVLSFSSKVEGSDGIIKITSSDNSLSNTNLSKLNYDNVSASNSLVQVNEGKNGIIKVNGVAIESNNNTFDDAVAGLEITINPDEALAKLDTKQYFKIEQDDSALIASVRGFISNYNGVIGGLKDLQGYDPDTNVAGSFNGDTDVRLLTRELGYAMMNQSENGSSKYNSLYSIGIKANLSGEYTITTADLEDAINDDRDAVVNLLMSGFSSNNENVTIATTETEDLDVFAENIRFKSIPTKAEASMGYDLATDPLSTPVTIDGGIELMFDSTVLSSMLGTGGDDLVFNNYAELVDQINKDLESESIPITALLNSVQSGGVFSTSILFSQDEVSQGALSFGSMTSIPNFIGITEVPTTPGVIEYKGVDYDYYGDFDIPDMDVSIDINTSKIKPDETAEIKLDKGYSYDLNSIIDRFLDEDGILDIKESALLESRTRIEDKLLGLNEKRDNIEERYLTQFQALDLQLVRLKSQSDQLTGQLAQIEANSTKN